MITISLNNLEKAGIKLAVDDCSDCVESVPNEVLEFFSTQMNPSPLFTDSDVMMTTIEQADKEDIGYVDLFKGFSDDYDGLDGDKYLVITEGGSTARLYIEYMKYCKDNPKCFASIVGVDPITFVLDDEAEKFYNECIAKK